MLAYGGPLNTVILLEAYYHGIFPWPQPNLPMLWFFPDPRCVLFPEKFHVSSRSRRKIRSSGFTITSNTVFAQVIRECSRSREADGGTWILPEMIKEYERLHQLGYAQSVETWLGGELVGGLYGVCFGRVFFGESMFHKCPEASRAALQFLVAEAFRLSFLFIDCQMPTSHMMRMGAELIPADSFRSLLAEAMTVCMF